MADPKLGDSGLDPTFCLNSNPDRNLVMIKCKFSVTNTKFESGKGRIRAGDPDPHGFAFMFSPGSGSAFNMRIRKIVILL